MLISNSANKLNAAEFFITVSVDDELIKTVGNYYDARIFASFDFAGEITNERLNNSLSGKEIVSSLMLEYIINVLFMTKHEKAIMFSISIFENRLYREI